MPKDRYRELFERSSDAILIIIGDKFVDCNDAATRMLRYKKKKDLLNAHPSQLSPERQPDGRLSYEKANEMIAEAFKNGSNRFEWEHRRADGEVFPVEVLLTAVKEADLDTLHVVWREISDRKQVEKSLLRLTSIIASTSDMVLTATPDGKIQFVNDAGLRMLGWEQESLADRKISDVHPEWALKAVNSGIQAAISEGIWTGESAVIGIDGREIFVSQVIMSHKSSHGELESISTIIRDISDRIEAENNLQSNLRLLNSIIENQPSCLKLVKFDGTLLDMNPAGLKIIQAKSKEEVIGKNVYDLVLDVDRERYRKFNERICRGENDTFTFSMYALDGSIHQLETVAVPLYLGSEKGTVQLGISTDITQKLSYEVEKKKLESQLNQARKMESIGTLAGGIAHDFNNILSAIMGFADIAMMESENPVKLRRDLEEILKGANRAKELVRQILTFSRESPQQIQSIKAQIVVEDTLKLLRSTIPTTIEIRTDINPDCQTILADPTQIHQIVMNLCTNAYQAMRGKTGTLAVSLQQVTLHQSDVSHKINMKPGSYIRLIVSDSGIGMSKEIQDKIFDPYFTTKEKGEGTGLGLSVVHGIVISLLGDITVYSEEGIGTTFNVYLPVIGKAVKEIPEREFAIPASENGEHILLVDDDEVIVFMLTIVLEQLGYQVTSLSSSLDALEMFKQDSGKYDLIISDMTMPKMTGEKLIKQILAIKPEIPVILCSGYSEMMDVETANAMGVSHYILKPVTRKDLAVAVNKALNGV
ncbi:MAG: PAS domain S-box protein [Candidatus Riflebacteria bacterium]|nr:PAS domain S-box protein [Candidatus Riflebacteria bacterium]